MGGGPALMRSAFGVLAVVSQLGLAIAVPVVGGVWLGVYLDQRWGLGGLMTLLCAFLGVAVGAFSGYGLVARGLKWKP